MTTRHLAAVALAMRTYQIEHDAALPATLAALVPGYLAFLPSDAIDGAPLRYDLGRAIVWSVGENEVDDGGDDSLIRPDDERDLWSMKDAVVHLTPQPRPATRPGE